MNLLDPESFDNDPYGHLTNQISHTALSLFVVYWLPFIVPYLIGFWVLWELRHLINSSNFQDFFEDLFFEQSGVAIYFIPWWSFVVCAILALTTYLRMRGK